MEFGTNSKFTWKKESPPTAKKNSQKKSEENKFTLPDIETYCTELHTT